MHGVGGQALRMLGGIGSQGIGKERGTIASYSIRDDQNPMVGAVVCEVLHGEPNEMVAIAGDEAAPLLGSPVKLLGI